MDTPVLILDNGAYTIKAGVAGSDVEPRFFPNAVARSRTDRRIFVSDEIDTAKDLSGIAYRRAFERGMLVAWDAEKPVWDRIFSPAGLDINPPDTSLLVTEPYFNLPNIAETYDQMVFEEWEFATASLVPYGGMFSDETDVPPECMVVVDVGYSYSHIVPIRGGEIVWEHVKRIDVGGKLLTNHLKHLISFRQWNMLDQTYVVNAVREACGTGYIRSGPNAQPPPQSEETRKKDEEEQVLFMGNERFAGPELLFNPSDIGINQTGLPETIAYVISQMSQELQGMFWANIGIVGGLGNIEALGERLERDLRTLCPTDYDIGIYEVFEPASAPYQAAVALTSHDGYLPTYPVTRSEYLEHGSSICRRKFGGPAYNIEPPGFNRDAEPVDEDEQELRYALGLDSIRGKGSKKRTNDEEVTSGNWGGRRRRAQEGGLLSGRP
ncbi:unnamed protein product [Cutaneotrichosporon oleaginosum]